MGKRSVLNWLALAILIVTYASCNQPLQKEEAEKYLRAADNELTQMARYVNESLAFNGMLALITYDNSPLPSIFSNRVMV